jgi:hypothetical protein
MCLLPEFHAARSRPRAALRAHGPGPIGPGRAGGDGRFARYYETTSNPSIIPGTRKVASNTLTSADRGGYAAFRKRAFRGVLTLSPTPSVPLGHHHLTQRGSGAQASLCFRSCIERQYRTHTSPRILVQRSYEESSGLYLMRSHEVIFRSPRRTYTVSRLWSSEISPSTSFG